MRLDYDLDASALYIQIADGDVAKTDTVDDETLIDLDSKGGVLGIEVISHHERLWPLDTILSRYHFDDEDAKLLRAYFQATSQERREAPAMQVEESRPLCVA